jgi:hypothetical protein
MQRYKQIIHSHMSLEKGTFEGYGTFILGKGAKGCLVPSRYGSLGQSFRDEYQS